MEMEISRYENPIPKETMIIGWIMLGLILVLAGLIAIKESVKIGIILL